MRLVSRSLAAAFVGALALPLADVAAQTAWAQAPSTRATTTVTVAARQPRNTPPAERLAPKKIVIDYGQPHVRGRAVKGGLIPNGEVWRLGANEATALTTDVALVIGGKTVPAGSYTLFALAEGDAMQLIVSRKTGQWGTDYDATMDLVRIPMKVSTLATPVEALQIALTPAADQPLAGTLHVLWGPVAASVGYTIQP